MNKVRQGAWILLLGLWGCQPAGTLPATNQPSPSPTPTVSPTPTPTTSPSASPTPTSTPTPSPTPLPTVTPSPTPSPTATPVPTPTPQATVEPLSFSQIKVIAGVDPKSADATLENGMRADKMLFPSNLPDLALDASGNIWFLNGSNDMLGQVTAEIVRNTNDSGDLKYRLYWQQVANLQNQGGMALDPSSGDFYVVQTYQNKVVRVNPKTGVITPVAGTGQQNYNGDGKALESTLNQPSDITRDGAGNFYITDTGNHLIRKLTPDGRLITIAGKYIQDTKVTDTNNDGRLDDEIPTYLPVGATAGDGGPARDAQVKNPRTIVATADGTLYFSSDSNTIRRISHDKIDKYAGSGNTGYNGAKFRAELANFTLVGDMQIGPDGLLYFADSTRIRRLGTQPNGELWIEDIAGSSNDSDLVSALTDPLKAEMKVGAMGFDTAGNLYVYDVAHRRLRMLERKNGNS